MKYETHGMSRTSTYEVWKALWYKHRNLEVVDSWLRFIPFFEYMGVRPPDMVLTRIFQNKPHGPRNSIWAPRTLAHILGAEYRLSQEGGLKQIPLLKHGHSSPRTATYNAWMGLWHGNNNFLIDKAFGTFEGFLAVMGVKPKKYYILSRRDFTLPHGPGNSYWKKDRFARPPVNKLGKLYPYEGKWYYAYQLARLAGLPLRLVHCRLRRNWTVNRAITRAVCKKPTWPRIEYNGKSLSVYKGACLAKKLSGLSVTSFYDRIRNHWPVKDAIEKKPTERFKKEVQPSQESEK